MRAIIIFDIPKKCLELKMLKKFIYIRKDFELPEDFTADSDLSFEDGYDDCLTDIFGWRKENE